MGDHDPTPVLEALRELGEAFMALEVKYPEVYHVLIQAADDCHPKLHPGQRPARCEARLGQPLYGKYGLIPHTGKFPAWRHQYHGDDEGVNQFRMKARTAAKYLVRLGPDALGRPHDVTEDDPRMHWDYPDLLTSFDFVDREYWAELWILVVHLLAWRQGDDHELSTQRMVWKDGEEAYDLRLIAPATDASDIPAEGRNLIIIADLHGALHFRLFDSVANRVVDTDESRMRSKAQELGELRNLIGGSGSIPRLSQGDKERIIAAVASMFDQTRAVGWPVDVPYDRERRERVLGEYGDDPPNWVREARRPADYFYSELPDNVFRCSKYAIDLIRDMNAENLEENASLQVRAGGATSTGLVHEHPGRQVQSLPNFLFRKEGVSWRLRFTVDARTESGDCPDLKGLSYYAVLLGRPNDTFSPIDLIRIDEGTIPPVDQAHLTELSLQAHLEESSQGKAARRSIGPHWTPQDAVDPEAIEQIKGTLPGLRAALVEAQDTRNLDRIEELTLEIEKVEEYLRVNTNKEGNPRLLDSDGDVEKARKRIYSNLSTVREKLRNSMPELVKHLDKYVEFSKGSYGYFPVTPRPDWNF